MTLKHIVFYTWVRKDWQRKYARTLINSIRKFGGQLRDAPIWVFELDPLGVPCESLSSKGVHIIPIDIPHKLMGYCYGDKVYVSARAEELAAQDVQSLIMLAVENLIINPPVLFYLSESYDAAVRPVHIKNVGLSASEPPDNFWKGVYQVVNVDDVHTTVESFIEGQEIRSYFNSAAFSVRPAVGIFRRWLECFQILVNDTAFQETGCQDDLHKIFLHQAVLSTLIACELEQKRVRILPPEYVYPYNLHKSVPQERKPMSLNELVSVYYESRTLKPGDIEDIKVFDPIKSWLIEQIY